MSFSQDRSLLYLRLCLAGLMVVFLSLPLVGQTQNGNILGSVKDASGAVVPNVSISATEQGTGFTRTVTSGPDGTYRLDAVPFGDYTITAEAPNFKKYLTRDNHLRTNETIRIDLTLEVGAVTQQVTVEAKAGIINADTGAISATQRQEFLSHHPARNFNAAWQVVSNTVSATETYMQFYGMPVTHLATTQDGIDYRTWGNYIITYAVEEVKLDALNAPAKYQKPATATQTMKGGTNKFHGKADFNLDNHYFWANTSPRDHTEKCTPGRPCTGTWRMGLVAGGPLFIPKVYDGRDKTFWNFTLTPQKYSDTLTPVTQQSPNAALRSGDISSLVSTSLKTCGGAPCIINPATGEPFPNNMVTNINSTSLKLIPRWTATDASGYNASALQHSTGGWYGGHPD